MFQKKKKDTPKTRYSGSILEDIKAAYFRNRDYVIVPAIGEEENWLFEFCEQRGYNYGVSHSTDGVVYYKIWGWKENYES